MFGLPSIQSFINGVVGAAVALVIAYPIAYSRGYSAADQRARVAELQAALKAAYQDLDAQRIAAEHSRKAAEENGRAAARYQEQIDAYEVELQARGGAARCLLDAADIERLSKHGVGSDHAAPARR